MAEFKVVRHLGSVLLEKDTVLKVRIVEVRANNGTSHATLSIHEWVKPRADYETTSERDSNGFIPTKKIVSLRIGAETAKYVGWIRNKLEAAVTAPEFKDLVEKAAAKAALTDKAKAETSNDTASRATAQYKALQSAGLKPKAIGAAMIAAWGEELAKQVMSGKAAPQEAAKPSDPPESIEEVS